MAPRHGCCPSYQDNTPYIVQLSWNYPELLNSWLFSLKYRMHRNLVNFWSLIKPIFTAAFLSLPPVPTNTHPIHIQIVHGQLHGSHPGELKNCHGGGREWVANVYYRNLSLSKYMKQYLAYHIAKISQVRMEISKYNVLNIYNRWMNIFHRPLNFCNNQCPFGRVPFPRLNYKDDISLEWSIYKFIWRI